MTYVVAVVTSLTRKLDSVSRVRLHMSACMPFRTITQQC